MTFSTSDMLIILAIAAGAAVLYGWSLKRHPMRPCKHCSGSGSHSDQVWKGAYGKCWWCHDKPVVRLGVKVFMPGTARAIQGGQHAKNY